MSPAAAANFRQIKNINVGNLANTLKDFEIQNIKQMTKLPIANLKSLKREWNTPKADTINKIGTVNDINSHNNTIQ